MDVRQRIFFFLFSLLSLKIFRCFSHCYILPVELRVRPVPLPFVSWVVLLRVNTIFGFNLMTGAPGTLLLTATERRRTMALLSGRLFMAGMDPALRRLLIDALSGSKGFSKNFYHLQLCRVYDVMRLGALQT